MHWEHKVDDDRYVCDYDASSLLRLLDARNFSKHDAALTNFCGVGCGLALRVQDNEGWEKAMSRQGRLAA